MRVCSIRRQLNQYWSRFTEPSVLSLVVLIIVALAFNKGVTLAALQTSQRPLTSYCDPFVGADGGGNTVPGAAVPLGLAQTFKPGT